MTIAASSEPIPGPHRRFSVSEYHRLIEAGLFDNDERVELLEGWIVAKMTRRPPHDAVVAQTAELLRGMLPAGAMHVRVQSALTTKDSEPEPDVAIVRGRALDYVERHPGPADVVLVVEVADSSVDRDRVKARVYARAGIGVYWIVNPAERAIEVYDSPSAAAPAPPSYERRQDYARGTNVPLVVGDETRVVAASDLLPE